MEAATGEWIVTLDADARPDPRLPEPLVARCLADTVDFLTVGGRFECPTAATSWLHASMLTTLVYRFGPPGTATRPDRMMANGQCMTLRRVPFLAGGGMALVAGEVVEDVALARRLATAGWSVAFLDASDLLTVRMFESLGDAWSGWGRSLALPGAERPSRQMFDLVVVLLAQALPVPRLLAGRGDVIDVILCSPASARWPAPAPRTSGSTPLTGSVRWRTSSRLRRSPAALCVEVARPGAVGLRLSAAGLDGVARRSAIEACRNEADERHQDPGGSSPVRALDRELHKRQGNHPRAAPPTRTNG